MRITALERRPGQKKIELHLDGGATLVVSTEVCLQFGLRAGEDLTASRLKDLRDAELRRDCLHSALRLLSYRQRTEAEVRVRLLRKGIEPGIVVETIERLRSTGLLDDERFARSWVEGRNQRAPRSRRLLVSELRAHGVTRTIVEGAAAAIDESDAAYRAAERRARALGSLPYPQFRQRIGGLLLRRGFGYDLVRATVDRLWREAAEVNESDH
jgi:regulatory protein